MELVATTSAGASIKLENRFPLHHLLPVATPLHTVKKSSIKMIFFSPPHLEGSSIAAGGGAVKSQCLSPFCLPLFLRLSHGTRVCISVCENVCTFWALSYTLASVRMASVWAAILLSGALQGEEGKTEGKISNSISISGQDCVSVDNINYYTRLRWWIDGVVVVVGGRGGTVEWKIDGLRPAFNLGWHHRGWGTWCTMNAVR